MTEVPGSVLTSLQPSVAYLDMLDSQPLYYTGWKHSACKSPPENGIKLLVQATNAQGFKAEGLLLEELRGCKAFLACNFDV